MSLCLKCMVKSPQEGCQCPEVFLFSIGIEGGIEFDLLLQFVDPAAKGIGDLEIDGFVLGETDQAVILAATRDDQPLLLLSTLSCHSIRSWATL